MSSRYDNGRGTATHLLQHYFRLVAQRAGVQWDSDNDAEVAAIVDAVIAASVLAVDARNAARLQARGELEALDLQDFAQQPAEDATQEDGAELGDLQCDSCLSHITSTYAVAYEDGYLCPACASAALAAVPVSAITYLMADIAPVDEGDTQKLHESRAAVIAWLESLEAEEDGASHDPMDVHESPSTTPYYHERED